MKKAVIIIALFVAFGWTVSLETAMTGGNFIILEDGFSTVEGVTSTGGTFGLFDFSDYTPGTLTDTNFILHGGFYYPDAASLTFSVSANTINLGTLSQTAVSSDSVTLTVTTDSIGGYSVSIAEDGNLRSGVSDINDVSDGTVSAGVEEYGIKTAGTAGLLANDTAISGTVSVMSDGGTVVNQTANVTFSASISGSSQGGSYSHSVTFTATANP